MSLQNRATCNARADRKLICGPGSIPSTSRWRGSDLSWDAEDAIIETGHQGFAGLPAQVQIRNQARVQLWYQRKFGVPRHPHESVEAAIDMSEATTGCLGVRLEFGDRWRIYAPHGLADVFNLVVRPNPVLAPAVERAGEPGPVTRAQHVVVQQGLPPAASVASTSAKKAPWSKARSSRISIPGPGRRGSRRARRPSSRADTEPTVAPSRLRKRSVNRRLSGERDLLLDLARSADVGAPSTRIGTP